MPRSTRGFRIQYFLPTMLLCGALLAPAASAQSASVTGQVTVVKGSSGSQVNDTEKDASDVVVWLTPLDHSAAAADPTRLANAPKLVQRNKAFDPHLLVVQTGTLVQFPNQDPFLHNVFSLFNGKRFDLGFYEAGSSKSVRFDRPGVSYLFCSIHEEMTAVVVAVDTPYFAKSDRSGRIAINDVPAGRYRLTVWYERGVPEELKNLEKVVEISRNGPRTLDPIRVVEDPGFSLAHKNKYGQDYVPPASIGYANPPAH